MKASTSTGANVPQAIAHIRQAGYTVRSLAAELAVSTSTVYRWAAGTRNPNPANLAALKDLVATAYGHHAHRRTDRQHVRTIEAAYEVLMSDADRAERDAFEAEMRAKYDAIRAEHVDEAQEQRRSAYAAIDPFALVATGQPAEQALPF